MPSMAQAIAETVVGPHNPMLVDCVCGGVNDYFTEYSAATRTIHSRRTCANIIRDHIVERVAAAFDPVPGVNVIRRATRGKYTVLDINGQMILRFKYLGRGRRSSNIKTPTSDAFVNNQEVVAGLSAQATRFDIGYIWNRLRTAIVEVLISAPTPTGFEYTITLWKAPAPVQTEIAEIAAQVAGETKVVPAAASPAATAESADATD